MWLVLHLELIFITFTVGITFSVVITFSGDTFIDLSTEFTKLSAHCAGVAMGSPLGPLMANAFMCNIEKQLETENKMPDVYKRYVDDTLSVMTNVERGSEFLTTLNNSHPSIDFTMELEENGRLPFLGVEVHNEEWMPARHKGVQKTDGQWATVTLPQPLKWEI